MFCAPIALDDARDERLLRRDGLRVEVRVWAAPGLRDEGEEGEDHRDVVAARRKQEGVERPQRWLVEAVGLGHIPRPTRPDAGADHVDSRTLHRGEVAIPDVWVRLEQEATVHVGRHVRCSGDDVGLTVAEQRVTVGLERGAAD